MYLPLCRYMPCKNFMYLPLCGYMPCKFKHQPGHTSFPKSTKLLLMLIRHAAYGHMLRKGLSNHPVR